MPKKAIYAKFTALPGKRDELLEQLRPLLDAVGDEPGTEMYAMHTAGDDDVWFYELYTDEDAFTAHAGGQALKDAFTRTGSLVAGRPEILMGEPLGGKGITI